MRLTIIGHGKMGHVLERVARAQGHQVVQVLTRQNNPPHRPFQGAWLEQTEVLIDFSSAEATPGNIRKSVGAGLPIVVGTTGWQDQLPELRSHVHEKGGACLVSSNFSLGVQILWRLVREAAARFAFHPDYRPYLLEIHHHFKKDSPSGTALTLQGILKEAYGEEVPLSALRAGFFPGLHEVGFDSDSDTLQLRHQARNRDGFARGALLAAEWIRGRKGFFHFEDVIFGESP